MRKLVKSLTAKGINVDFQNIKSADELLNNVIGIINPTAKKDLELVNLQKISKEISNDFKAIAAKVKKYDQQLTQYTNRKHKIGNKR